MPTTATPHPDVRRPTGSRRPLAVALVVAALVAGSALAWWASQAAQPDVRQRLLAYRVLDDHRVEIRFEVTKPAERDAECVLRARDRGSVEVGRAVLRVGVSDEGTRTTEATHVLPTSSRAILGEVYQCRLVGAP